MRLFLGTVGTAFFAMAYFQYKAALGPHEEAPIDADAPIVDVQATYVKRVLKAGAIGSVIKPKQHVTVEADLYLADPNAEGGKVSGVQHSLCCLH